MNWWNVQYIATRILEFSKQVCFFSELQTNFMNRDGHKYMEMYLKLNIIYYKNTNTVFYIFKIQKIHVKLVIQ